MSVTKDDFWCGRRVFITGHTGFKGAWLTLWLTSLGASVTGFALAPEKGSLFDVAALASGMEHHIGDIRDPALIRERLVAAKPEFVFHLAAQPLVRRSYREPVETWQTNVMGTIHVLEAMRALDTPCTGVLITTDKVYENREWQHAYREVDSLGGHDPYSSSKAAAEIAIASWRASFLPPDGSLRIASARAGNVIGGGDWAEDRIVPDCMRALRVGEPLKIRNPRARRPWQHVLEPLSGYLMLAEQLSRRPDAGGVKALASAFNFGPPTASNRMVADLAGEIFRDWPGSVIDGSDSASPHEATELNLATDKAFHRLGWTPRWDFSTTVRETVRWYKNCPPGTPAAQVREFSLGQITSYASWHAE
jgi:CDP-glucose 4,6-dehydratase